MQKAAYSLPPSLPAPGYGDPQSYVTPNYYGTGIDYFSSMKFDKYPIMTSNSMTSTGFGNNSMNMHNAMSSHMAAGLNGMSPLSNYGHHQAYPTSQSVITDMSHDYKDTGNWSKFHAM